MKTISIPKKVNSTVVRLVGGQVFLLSLLYILTDWALIPAFLAIDFAIRASGYPRFSLLAETAILISKVFGLKNRPIFFAPKRFAALIGLILSLTALILSIVSLTDSSLVFIAVLGLFSFLESGFDFCAGCKIFGFLMHKGWIPTKYCSDCAY
ncbi:MULTISPECIES: DUF4395 domain-containing protein [unclassified Oceanispirochaeta]|uniref:DUF4395 domain-containing protein n=1 Tax=unclassified Oceanispirochaeta TaxID=2635722 RepID=UPI000E09AABB|nr:MULTISPECIES: DUF4395 domain-containing protein [unclassified Oceanispirochaeta]MBF9014959.1 DUF4395 domain-containing protein [Oceanispirochaeta sp. M2]NPD71360.1 DUF4395 domain-containing protein [Oceanispirochaeta sp. M1]RDG33325.1 DUF4395 domain-containing protein [Oceanispirochaeta sp. M1]